ncbi:hypothetical protein [Rhodobacter capsulatus]|uniref:hypothetical protein n=1 Tax=Rhodobacter capsulatus TaxID=1061 RepID=UPI004027577B
MKLLRDQPRMLGTTLIFPSNRDKAMAEEFGIERAAEIARTAEHLPRRVPLAKEWIAAVWSNQGLTDAEIARRLHVTDVTVRAWRAKKLWRGLRKAKSADPRQLPLI